MLRFGLALALVAAIASPTMAQEPSNVPVAVAYFGYEEATLTDFARENLEPLAIDFLATRQSAAVVTGHTDTAERDPALAQRRAELVRDYLVSLGVPTSTITVQAYGEDRPAIDTPDNVREPQNRRVEVVVGAPSGW